ncbi:hypothetical protein HD596_005509 [Nonomuraea jabiensis]|uniref:Uncharacterized protein n=1 Tax=Nonomuraea jabiensis TaxID=882448 RepID=A0A7W9LCP3_9ACTN|nr:hypothetical protein [Nonomuraea jabiensis]
MDSKNSTSGVGPGDSRRNVTPPLSCIGATSQARLIAKPGDAESVRGSSCASKTAASGTPMVETYAMSRLTEGRIVPRSICDTALAEMPSSRATARSDFPERVRSSRSR